MKSLFSASASRVGKISVILLLLLISESAYSQYSNLGFSFQGYAIDAEGKALASKGVTARFTVYRTGVSYVEEHALTTDSYGVFVANVGKGTPSGSVIFSSLDFNNFDFSLKVEVRETTGGTFATISDKALQAVPYARSASNGVPVGTIVAFAGPSTNIPEGWLLCDGTNLNATANPKYAQLFASIGTTWGGTGVASFNAPDLRGMFLRGLNKETTGTDANRVLGSQQNGEIQSHNHGVNDPGHNHINADPAWANLVAYTSTGTTAGVDNTGAEFNVQDARPMANKTTGITIQNGGGAETRPINKAVNYIIKF